MLCINNTYTNAYFNIAAEEYFLKNSQENIFMLYRNEPSVIIGKHQNVQIEVNTKFVEDNQIKIVRRFSGGGAVFQDMGNINISFIENGNNLNFDRFTNAMIEMLSHFGLDVEADNRRALKTRGYKISGSAQGIYKNRVMYHATLLFSSDLESLETSLKGSDLMASNEKSHKLSVRSVKSPVANIIGHLKSRVTVDEFSKQILTFFLNKNEKNSLYELSEKDIAEIKKLSNNKYSTKEWNYDALIPCSEKQNKAALITTSL